MSGLPVIDCDVHCAVAAADDLLPYFGGHWPEYMREAGFTGGEAASHAYPPGATISARPDARPDGRPAGSDLDLLRAQALDGVELAILNCCYGVEQVRNPDFQGALVRALNDWIADRWLEREPRLRASIVVGSDPLAAAAEVERVAADDRFVQVLLPVRSSTLYGQRRWDPLYEAAVEHGLAVAVHAGGVSGNPFTPNGWPSYFFEEYVGMSAAFQTQLLSMIGEGLFERFPALRVVLLESGVAWLPSLMWRLDKEWKGIRREVPWVRRAPSEYVREHVRVTVQPLDAPADAGALARLVDQLGSDDLLLYASDYPHAHAAADGGDARLDDLLAVLAEPARAALLAGTARGLYRFETADREEVRR